MAQKVNVTFGKLFGAISGSSLGAIGIASAA
ncbi:MAG: hypothetical protein ACI9RO_002248 [Alteromonas macleodii]|jgi:hypothetical protein